MEHKIMYGFAVSSLLIQPTLMIIGAHVDRGSLEHDDTFSFTEDRCWCVVREDVVHAASRDYAHLHIYDLPRTWPYHELIITCVAWAVVHAIIDLHVHRGHKLVVGRISFFVHFFLLFFFTRGGRRVIASWQNFFLLLTRQNLTPVARLL